MYKKATFSCLQCEHLALSMATSGFIHSAAGAKRLLTIISIATQLLKEREVTQGADWTPLTEAPIPGHLRM